MRHQLRTLAHDPVAFLIQRLAKRGEAQHEALQLLRDVAVRW